MPKPDTRMDDKRREVAKKALEDDIRKEHAEIMGEGPIPLGVEQMLRARRDPKLRGERASYLLGPGTPEEANVEAEEFLRRSRDWEGEWQPPSGQVAGGPEAERYPGEEFRVAQASTPAGGETVSEAAMGHTLNPSIEREDWHDKFQATWGERFGEDAGELYMNAGKFIELGIIPEDSEFAQMYRAMDPHDEDIREAHEGRQAFGEEFPAHRAAAEKEHEARGVPYPARDEAREKRVAAQRKKREGKEEK